MTRALYAHDPELGPVKYCRRCDDWYPLDAEFWYFDKYRPSRGWCRACWDEKRRGRTRRHTQGFTSPCARCLTVSTRNPECHGCASRFDGPLTVEKLASWGFTPTAGTLQ